MISFPNCKINLGLNVIRKREDGFHDIETSFYPVPFTDILEIAENKENTEFTLSGIHVPDSNNNLCLAAYDLLQKDYPLIPSIKLHLHKAIPVGAGLGGGSSDAAFTLLLLNEKFHLGLSREQLLAYAMKLGSDVPFFIYNTPCLATGRGEKLNAIDVNLKGYELLLVNPGIHISTAWAFSEIKPRTAEESIAMIIQQPLKTWRKELKNDFEVPVFTKHPEIYNIKQSMYKDGAIYASLSGSGSTVYGLFEKKVSLDSFNEIKYYSSWVTLK